MTMLYQNSIYRIMGDRSLIIEFGDEISPEMNQRVMEFTHTMAANPIEGVVETIPAYRSLLIVYDPLKISFNVLKQRIDDLQKKIGEIQTPEPKIIEIPVVYGGYRKIATVITSDLPLLGQLKPGDKVKFKKITLDQAYRALRKTEMRMDRFKERLSSPD